MSDTTGSQFIIECIPDEMPAIWRNQPVRSGALAPLQGAFDNTNQPVVSVTWATSTTGYKL